MAQMAFSSAVLLPCPWVLYQWFIVLFRVHRWYMIDDFPGYAEFEKMMQVTINEIKSNATFLNDANDLQLEDAIGSDVAHVQSTEINVNVVDEDDTMMNGENDSDGSLPLQYSFVLSSSQDNHLNNATKLKAFQKMVNTGSAELQHDDFQVNSVLNATEDTLVTNDQILMLILYSMKI